MAILTMTFWAIITYPFILKAVGAQFSCELLDGVMIECKYNSEEDRIVLKKRWLPVSRNAQSLVMSSCGIEGSDIDVFEELPLLLSIDFSSNFLGTVAYGTFDNVPLLEELDLSDNCIDYLPGNLFQRNHNLKKLNLKDNLLHNIDIELFKPLVNLIDLDLSENRLHGQNISHDLFLNNVNMKSITFSYNNMSETPSDLLSALNNLERLEFRGCYLNEIPSFLMAPNLKTLKSLSLKTNRITKIDKGVFDHLNYLETLFLSYNKIEYINEYSFRNLPRLNFVTLNRNLLDTVPQRLFRNTPKLNYLNLSRNKLTSLPDHLFKKNNMSLLSLSYNKLTYLQSNFCKQQQNPKALKYFLFNNNPWQCACLRELLGEVKDLKIGYHNVYFDGVKPVCATTSQFVCKRDESLNSFYVDLFNNSSRIL